MLHKNFPIIDLAATARNISRLRRISGYSVRDLQAYFGFESPQAIYNWQSGRNLPCIDHLYALSVLFETEIDDIIIGNARTPRISYSHPLLSLRMSEREPMLWTLFESKSGHIRAC
ncbi:MAG: hypothetical protein LBG82_03225 [Clostridiales Family XIII bacterium]|jgi:transcriptional regulator with XRE-family HTH domain|nr:hypothetical protein [Clostridiales Family XIII bacterium]